MEISSLIGHLQNELMDFDRMYDEATLRIKNNPFVEYVFHGPGPTAKAALSLMEWEDGVRRLLNGEWKGHGKVSVKLKDTCHAFLERDPFVEASIILELASYFRSELFLVFAGVIEEKSPAPSKRKNISKDTNEIVKTCRSILDGYKTLSQHGLYPGPGRGVGNPNFLDDVKSILDLYSDDYEVLTSTNISWSINGVKHEYQSSKKARHLAGPRYLVLRLRHLLTRAFSRKDELVNPILLPIAFQIGATRKEETKAKSLKREFPRLKMGQLKDDFNNDYQAIVAAIPSKLAGKSKYLKNFAKK